MVLPNPTTLEVAMLHDELERRGITLHATDSGGLGAHPKSLLTESDKSRLMALKWDLLEALGFKGGVTPATPATPATQGGNADTYAESAGGTPGGILGATPAESLPPLVRRHLKEAGALGLGARWSREFGYISIHDPTAGEWHDLPTEAAPQWSRNEASKRKELRKKRGITRLLTQKEMEEIWKDEAALLWEKPAATTAHGILYEDYLEVD